jgi:hypothetical protein
VNVFRVINENSSSISTDKDGSTATSQITGLT